MPDEGFTFLQYELFLKYKGESFIMDQIIIQDLSIYAKHGVYMEENILGQQFLVSVYMDLDLSRAGQTDSLEHTLDYGKICHFVTKYMQSHTFKLIEAAAEHLAQELLLTYDPIKKIRIKVKKTVGADRAADKKCLCIGRPDASQRLSVVRLEYGRPAGVFRPGNQGSRCAR